MLKLFRDCESNKAYNGPFGTSSAGVYRIGSSGLRVFQLIANGSRRGNWFIVPSVYDLSLDKYSHLYNWCQEHGLGVTGDGFLTRERALDALQMTAIDFPPYTDWADILNV